MSDESNIVHAHLMINGQRHPNGTSGSIVSPTSYNKHSTSSISDTSDASCRGTIDNRTSMHRCLQITEILTLILDCYDDYAPDKNTLLQLALVCKAFHEPALDALWKFQQSFMILVMTFPRDLWEVTVVPYIPVRNSQHKHM
jgi:F-box-like